MWKPLPVTMFDAVGVQAISEFLAHGAAPAVARFLAAAPPPL